VANQSVFAQIMIKTKKYFYYSMVQTVMTAYASSRWWPGWSRDTANCLIGAMQDWKPIESAELQCCMRASLLFYFMCYH